MAWATEQLKREAEGFPKEIYQKIETVLEGVQSAFRFLQQFGYAVAEIKFPESALHKYFTTIFLRSERVMRGIMVSYYPYDDRGNSDDTIAISIMTFPETDPSHPIDPEAHEDYMDFDLYLEHLRPDLHQDVFDTRHYEGTFAERLDKVLNAYAYYMKDVAEDIINGESWESGHCTEW